VCGEKRAARHLPAASALPIYVWEPLKTAHIRTLEKQRMKVCTESSALSITQNAEKQRFWCGLLVKTPIVRFRRVRRDEKAEDTYINLTIKLNIRKKL
jgi:hypothetical protein